MEHCTAAEFGADVVDDRLGLIEVLPFLRDFPEGSITSEEDFRKFGEQLNGLGCRGMWEDIPARRAKIIAKRYFPLAKTRGGFCNVLHCIDREKGRVVSIKSLKKGLDKRSLQQFRQEIFLLKRMRGHPCYVQILDVLPDNKFVLEFIPGVDIETLVETTRKGRINVPVPERVRLAAIVGQEVALGLADFHDATGYIDLDVKSGNVFVTRDGVKKLDLNCAGLVGEQSDLVPGTPAFMSPEQTRGFVGKESDLYSLGCVLYHILALQHVFLGEAPAELMRAHREKAPSGTMLPDPARFLMSQIILNLLEKKAEERVKFIEKLLGDSCADNELIARKLALLFERHTGFFRKILWRPDDSLLPAEREPVQNTARTTGERLRILLGI